MNQLHQIRIRLESAELQKELISFGVSHVSIFGSYARSEANKESDLDLLIDVTPESGVTLGILEEIENLLRRELSVPRVDFVFERSMNPRLRPYIEKDLVKIY